MKKILLLVLSSGLTSNFALGQFSSVTAGDWTDPITWGNVGSGLGAGDDYPGPGDDVFLSHAVDYDLTGNTTTYNSITFNGGSELEMIGDASISNNTILGVNSDLNLNGPLTLGPNTVFLLHGNLTLNSNGQITYLDKASVFRLDNPNANANFNDTLRVENGIFAMQSNGSQAITINGNALINVGMNGAFYLEGSHGTASISGALIMEPGSELVANLGANLSVNVNGSGSITFQYGSSFFQGDNVGTISITGNAPVWEIELTNSAAGWRHICSPFAGTNLTLLNSTDFNPNVTPGQENIYWWNADGGGAGNPAPGWQVVTSLSTIFVAGGTPIAIYTGGTYYPFTNNGIVSIQNSVTYQSSYEYDLYNSDDPATDGTHEGDQGWNLIGNPYPTWLNLDTILKVEMAGEYQGAHMWDANAGQYKAYVVGGETIERTHDSTGSSVDSISNKYIRPFQAFWLKMDSSSGDSTKITIDHPYRAINPTAAPPSYFRTAFIPRLRLNAYAAADSAWDQVLVTMNPNSNKLRLGSEDAFDRPSANDRPNMALIHDDGERLCIDSRPLDSATVIPMVFEQGVDGATYYIGMVDDQFDPSMSAFLEDVKTNTLHDLKNGAYNFVHNKGYKQTRFNIHLAPHFVSQNEIKLAKSNFQIWTANDKVFVQLDKAGLNQTVSVEVFDISGKLIFETATKAEYTHLNIPLQIQTGAHIIKVSHPQYGSKMLKTMR